MAVEAVVAWYRELREVECLEESMRKQVGSISRRLTKDKDLSEAEVAKLKEERRDLQKMANRIHLDMSPRPDFSCMTEAQRAATAERLRSDELDYALRLMQEGDPRGWTKEAFARLVDFDPKQDGLYYNRCTLVDLTKFDLDEESPVGPMRYINSPYKRESDFLCLCTAVNFLTVKIASSDVGFPIFVYGTVIVRDSIDDRCVYHFRRDSDNCQLINFEDKPLILTGPKRGLALTGDIYVEINLKIKDDLVQDRELSKGLISIRNTSTGPSGTGYKFQTISLASRLSTVDVKYTVVDRALEATIAVEVVQGGFHGKITACTANMEYRLVLYDSKDSDAMTVDECGVLELRRPVLCVHVNDLLLISAQTDYDESVFTFNPMINDRAEGLLVVGNEPLTDLGNTAQTEYKLRVKLCWSVMNP